MAINTDKGVQGMVGKLVFYNVKGRTLIRTKSGKRTKKRGQKPNPINTIFGTVSRYGTRMISAMSDNFLFPFTIETYNHTRGWMRDQYAANKDADKWELLAKNNLMFPLHPEADLRDFFQPIITVRDEGGEVIHIDLPAFDPAGHIKAPPHTVKVNMKMILIRAPFKDTGITYSIQMEKYCFDYNNNELPPKTFTFDTKYQNGRPDELFGIIVLALEFETTDSGKPAYNKDKRWLPAAIVAMGRMKD